ncbi:MAG: hypothetical protein J6Q60_04600 [Bacteroidaceae bacterium]|nr:hypothetical protein [Bacteroidaceae bacterium]MBO7168412.1 hypothetical protein [Bacteroidaceae bacterium]
MGFFNDVRQQWTVEGMKTSLRKNWMDIVAVIVASLLTPAIILWFGWTANMVNYFCVFLIIDVILGVVLGITLTIIKKSKK